MTAWKDFERRTARMFGGQRSGPLGRNGSDGDAACLVSLECKRTAEVRIRTSWIEQARRQGATEGRPWVLAVARHNDRTPIAIVDLKWLAELVNPTGKAACPYCGAPTKPGTLACRAHSDLPGKEPL